MSTTNVYGLPEGDGSLEFGDQDLVPKMTSILGSGGVVEEIRGLAAKSIKPVSAAVVIGLGGSGVQTVSRVKSAVRAGRSDQDALDAVAFLGLDAVGEKKQNPPLPAGVTLGPDLVNLSGFNAAAYLRGQLPNDSFLQAWWDDDYNVPSGELTDGLKRERMLGRLCFHQESPRIRRAVDAALCEALGIRSEHVAEGSVGSGGKELAVYLVASSVGGTGSSAFLEVLGAIHEVARARNVTPKIRAFLLLPGAFSQVTARQQSADVIAQAQRANAYGFFKELDHFLAHESELPKVLGYDDVELNNGDLLHSAYLFDSNVGSEGIINSVEDIYEIAAESIYQFMFSEMGRAILGVNGTNIERALKEVDDFKKPRRYCSLGLSRVVFPGDTYRLHLVMWWSDWFIRTGFLKEPTPEQIVELSDSDQAAALLDSTASLVQRSGEGAYDDSVRVFLDIGREASKTLEAQPNLGTAEEIFSTLEDDVSGVVSEVRRTLEILRPRLLVEMEQTIEESVFSEGASIPRARELVKVVLKRARAQLADATSTLNAQISMKATSAERVDDRMDALAEAANRNIAEQVGALVFSTFNDDVRTAKDLARETGKSIKDWTQAVIGAEVAQARQDFLRIACKRLANLQAELENATSRLLTMAEDAKTYWERDELIGKDAGPEATTVLVPGDTLPEVELSKLSRGLRIAIADEHAPRLQDEPLQAFVSQWIRDSLTRGFFDVGSEDPLTAERAQSTLLASLERDAVRYGLTVTDDEGNQRTRLPADLLEAAQRVGETTRLQTGLTGLEQLSRQVCWSWEPGRFQLPSDPAGGRKENLRPEVTTAVTAHRSVAELVIAEFPEAEQRTNSPDPERIVALSCEWALPIHCLPVVDTWRKDYDALAARRKQQRQNKDASGIEPPNHIDKRFEAFDELVPEYFKPEVTAPLFVKGLLISIALTAESTSEAVIGLYRRDATRLPVSPVRQERGIGFVARSIVIDDGELAPAPPDSDQVLGATWFQALRSIGLDVGLRNVIAECWGQVFQAVDPEQLLTLIDDVLGPRIARGSNKRRLDPNEKAAFGHLANALADLRDELSDFV